MSEQDTYPGVDLAYDLVVPSYQLVAARFEAADGRLTTLLTIASTVTFAAPIFVRNVREDVIFGSPWFIVGAGLYVLTVVMCLAGRLTGHLRLIDPAELYGRWLHKTPWQFKKDAIYFAGLDFADNVRAVDAKANFSIIGTISLVLEIAALMIWLAWQ